MSATDLWRLLLVGDLVLLLLLAVSWPFQPPGSAGRVISVVSAAFIVVTLVGSYLLLRREWEPF